MSAPVLYSFRRCPYCMRAHMALKYSAHKVELREVELKSIPEECLNVSSAGTVPVLVIADDQVLDESWEIMKWSLDKNDPHSWSGEDNKYLIDTEMLVETNDYSFKTDLDHYKYADRYPEHDAEHYRSLCEEFIEELEDLLSENNYLLTDRVTVADIAIFPFIRQFSLVDIKWFEQSPYPNVQRWLKALINSDLFQHAFQKHETWNPGDTEIYL